MAIRPELFEASDQEIDDTVLYAAHGRGAWNGLNVRTRGSCRISGC
jgi:hypothetical protein